MSSVLVLRRYPLVVAAGLETMLTGSMALNHYAQLWMTRVIDIVLALFLKDLNRLLAIFDEAKRRQSENRGSTVLGAVMKHLVGAKLEMLYPDQSISHSGYSVADSPTGRSGDFEIGDCVIHVTTAPAQLLLQKCIDNLDRRLRPLVVSTNAGAAMAENFVDQAGMSKRIEVLDITQFLVANMLEWTAFEGSKRRNTFEELITRYNDIVEACETDPSLKIEVA